MADIERQFHEDRMLRDAARQLLTNGIDRLRGEGEAPALPARALGEAKDGTAQLLDGAVDFARSHKAGLGAGLAVGLAAALGWIFRDRIADAVHALSSQPALDDTDDDQP